MDPKNAKKFFGAAGGELRRPHSSSDAGEDPSEREADQASEPVPSSAPPGTAVERISSAIGTFDHVLLDGGRRLYSRAVERWPGAR